MRIDLLTPLAGLVALACVVPLVALLAVRRVARRRRRGLDLDEPRKRAYLLPVAALAAAAACIGFAATQPIVSFDEKRRVRTDAEAIVVLDTTRSMLASATPGSPARIARAKAVARVVRESLPEVPVGLASLTDRTLPHLFPSADAEVFEATLAKAIGIERPPPVHSFSTRITSLESLSAVATQGFFSPSARRRALVVLTDGESIPATRARLGPLFRRPPAISTVFVHVWGRDERVFRGATPEPAYRADPGSRAALERLAAELRGSVHAEGELVAVTKSVTDVLGRGPSIVRGERRRDIPLAAYLAGMAFLPLGLLLWQRDR